ncbi:hypothetical protein A3860_36340 [Niastella vici]|uniref:Uncharacterized protein n=1 Tax=Niastella vici TaxID=1703345 RepID=A0A1V9FN99_9BACT|nr:hypothetical protein A3860_36340 [Niastella vici]
MGQKVNLFGNFPKDHWSWSFSILDLDVATNRVSLGTVYGLCFITFKGYVQFSRVGFGFIACPDFSREVRCTDFWITFSKGYDQFQRIRSIFKGQVWVSSPVPTLVGRYGSVQITLGLTGVRFRFWFHLHWIVITM